MDDATDEEGLLQPGSPSRSGRLSGDPLQLAHDELEPFRDLVLEVLARTTRLRPTSMISMPLAIRQAVDRLANVVGEEVGSSSLQPRTGLRCCTRPTPCRRSDLTLRACPR